MQYKCIYIDIMNTEITLLMFLTWNWAMKLWIEIYRRCTLNYENIESLRLLGAILKEHQSWFGYYESVLWHILVSFLCCILSLNRRVRMCTYTLKLQDNKWYLPISEECDPSLYTRSRCCFEWKQKGGSRQGLSQMDWHVHCLKGAQRKKRNWCEQHY